MLNINDLIGKILPSLNFVFFYQEENPFAALTFYWEPLLRSVKRKFKHKNLKYSKS